MLAFVLMSKEALWNFLSKNLSEAELKNLQELNIEDEFENEQYKYLKTTQADTKIEISALHASIKNLKLKTAGLKKEHTFMHAKLMEMETEVERLQREKTTLQDSYVDLSKKYQLSRITTVEATDPLVREVGRRRVFAGSEGVLTLIFRFSLLKEDKNIKPRSTLPQALRASSLSEGAQNLCQTLIYPLVNRR